MWAIAKPVLKSSNRQLKIAVTNLLLLHDLPLERESDVIGCIKDIIQGLITSPITRNEGYLLLDAVTKSNPCVYIHSWGPIIISSLENPDNCISKHVTLQILIRLVRTYSGNTSTTDAFQRFIPEIIPLLLKTAESSEEAMDSCKVLAVCMQCLPAVVGPFSDEIQSFLMKHAGSIDFKTEEGVADCFAAIPICIKSRLKTKTSYSEVWLDSFLKLLNTLQSHLNDILKNYNVDGSCVNVDELPKLLFPPEEEENDEYGRVHIKIKKFVSLCTCLSKMMSVHTDSDFENMRVKVPVQELLKCLERIFLVYDYIKGTHSSENSIMNLNYPIMQIAVLTVLESLSMNFTIIEQSGNVMIMLNKIILTTVSETKEPWAWYVRSSTWKVADTWLKCYGPNSSYDIVNNKLLINELLKDIIPEQESGILQTPKKDRREECCKEALNVLCSILIFRGAFMDQDFMNDISCTVLKVSCKVQQSSHPSKKTVNPYTNSECRLNLYQCLLQASLSDPMKTKYVKQALNIFRFATKDPHFQVRTVGFTALSTLRFYIQPKKPLPEALSARVQQQHPLEEESAQAGWESGFNWAVQNDSSQEERSMDQSPPCQIESVYHNSLGSDSRRDPTQASPHYADALGGTQCNGSSQPNQPSHSNIDSESADIKEYGVEEMMEDSLPHAPVIEMLKPESRPHLVELKPALLPGKNHQEDDDPHFPEVESSPPQRMAENGGYAESEDEENSDEEDDEGSDEEEENIEGYAPQYAASLYSPVSEENEASGATGEYYPEKKRRRISNQEEQSSGEELEEQPSKSQEETEDVHHPTVHVVASRSSPTVDEMCQDFVLAEPEEIR